MTRRALVPADDGQDQLRLQLVLRRRPRRRLPPVGLVPAPRARRRPRPAGVGDGRVGLAEVQAPEHTARGSCRSARCRRTCSPTQGYIVNWNNKQARGWRSADDEWSYGSVHRSERLEDGIRKGSAGGASSTCRPGEGDGVGRDDRPARPGGLPGAAARDRPRRRARDVAPLLRTLDSWRGGGAHRRDLDGDNVYDEGPAVALMDAWWPRLVRAQFEPVVGERFMTEAQKMNPFVRVRGRAAARSFGLVGLRRQGPAAGARPARARPAVAALLRPRQPAPLPGAAGRRR